MPLDHLRLDPHIYDGNLLTMFRSISKVYNKASSLLESPVYCIPAVNPHAITMLGLTVLATALVAAQTTFASPLHLRSEYSVKETHNVPPRWSVYGDPRPSQLLQLTIGLQPNNFALLEQHLHEGRVSPDLCTDLKEI
jgi:hypothetical protein